MTHARRRLRAMLHEGEMIVAPGVYDGATAMLVEGGGFDAVYMTGAGVSSTFGLPDYGLLTLTEMAGQAGRIARSVAIPLIADADTGFGNELNVTRTIHEYEAAGVAALHIEDQLSPKRCGHLDGKEIVSREEFLIKIRAAVAARSDPDLVVIARTDALATASFEEAIWRANAALDAGADVAFVEAMRSEEQAASVPRLVHGPCLLNMVKGGVTPVMATSQAREMGFAIVIAPALVFGTVVGSAVQALQTFRDTGVHPEIPGDLTPAKVFALLGAPKWDSLRTSMEA